MLKDFFIALSHHVLVHTNLAKAISAAGGRWVNMLDMTSSIAHKHKLMLAFV